MDELNGEVAVVTGAASGIGLAFVRRFAAEGMSVVLADVEADALDAAEKLLVEDIGADQVLAVRTDVRDAAAVHALADATFERFGTAHVICNNAGVLTGGLSWMIEPERWKWLIEVNLLGVAYGITAFVPRLVEQGEGHVVNTASAAGLLTGPGMAPYFAAKHAVVAMSESLLFDLQLSGSSVGVTCVCPEWVDSRISEAERNLPPGVAGMAASDDPASTFMRDTIMGAVSTGTDPAEIAALVCDAVKSDTFYVLPHDTTLPIAKQRWATIEAGGKPGLGQLGLSVDDTEPTASATYADVDRSRDPAEAAAWMDRLAAWPVVQAYKAHIHALLDDVGGAVLDVGCGLGNDVRPFGDRGIGLDPSSTMLTTASARGGTFVAGDAHCLPFSGVCFGGVRADRVLQHLADPHSAARELVRVTKPLGLVVVADPDQATLRIEGPEAQLSEIVRRYRAEQGIRNGFIARQMVDVLTAAGATEVERASWTMDIRDPNDAFGITTWSHFLHQRGWFGEVEAQRFDASLAMAAARGHFRYRVDIVVTWGRA